MGELSKIEWTDHTFNGWVGCTKVSPACDHCYAESWANRFGDVEWGNGKPRRLTSDANWRKPLGWHRKALAAGERHRVFSNSLSDVFDNEVPDEWRDRLFNLIVDTYGLDWLLLTKRPHVARKYLKDRGCPNNVWLGTTVESEAMARVRVPILQDTPARVRFLSMEPLLGPVNIGRFWADWIIVGGESGTHARDMDPAWARSIRDQCAEAGIPFFMKQMTRKAPIPDDLMVRQFPRAA